MSQRGSLHYGAQKKISASWLAHIRSIVLLSLALTFGSTLTLIAQDTPPPKMVTICVDGSERLVATSKDTVQTLLHQENIVLGTHDRCEPPITAPVENFMIVNISRVVCEITTREISLPPSTVTRWDRRLSDKPVVLREGRPGLATETVITWKKDGVVSEQWAQNRKVVRQPTPTVILRGSLPSRAGLNVRRVMTMTSTAYDPGPLSCGPRCTGRTATGMKATRGVIAVDPRVIPLGTRVFVDGYGPAIAADTGGAIKGNKIDVCFDSRGEALQWGRRTVMVIIYE